MRVPEEVRGAARDGSVIEETAHTGVVSPLGARVRTVSPLQMGTDVVLTSQFSQQRARFRVAWVGEEQTGGLWETGIESLAPLDDVWGVHFPPKPGSDSIWFWKGRKAARPKSGRFTVSVHRERPLQDPRQPTRWVCRGRWPILWRGCDRVDSGPKCWKSRTAPLQRAQGCGTQTSKSFKNWPTSHFRVVFSSVGSPAAWLRGRLPGRDRHARRSRAGYARV